MKTLHQMLILFLILMLTVAALVYDAFFSAPSRYNVRYEELESIYIPEEMNDISILFFSDLDYGTFMNEERAEKLQNTINGLSPDIVIFGGDLVDQEISLLDEEQQEQVTSFLKNISAPLGKFAVMGDFDRANEELTQQVENILYDGEFELLNNRSIYVHNKSAQAIVLVGLDNEVNGYPDVNTAYANVSRTYYTITICHTPDTANDVPEDLTNYFLAGHSHGGQVCWGWGSMYLPAGASTYLKGKQEINGAFTLDITNGVGTTIKDVRFLANAEVVLYRLKHETITE